MKGLITVEGQLKISRGKSFKHQFCPYRSVSVEDEFFMDAICTDHCPLFGEPESISPNEHRLELCHGKVLKFTELEDERANRSQIEECKFLG
jgi:hypothetical protein